jgi:tRNA(Ser,Leu) C12 N-acetylase TAN1
VKIKTLLQELSKYDENEEILVLYFDKESTQDYLEQELTDTQWAQTVEKVEAIPMAEINYISETINEQAEKVLREGRVSK